MTAHVTSHDPGEGAGSDDNSVDNGAQTLDVDRPGRVPQSFTSVSYNGDNVIVLLGLPCHLAYTAIIRTCL